MSCPYYWWNNHYACRKSGKDVNDDLYYKYCRNYDYSDCPIYKGDDSSGGCFLTSACVEARGLTDDCYELMVLRRFRDEWLLGIAGGKEKISEYYRVAPVVVDGIRQREDSAAIFQKIYDELVVPCVALIEEGKNQETYEHYREYTLGLKRLYGSGL